MASQLTTNELRDMVDAQARWFLSQDNSGHWYLVPDARRDEWYAWLEIDEDDSRAWNEPDFARRLGGSPSAVTFADPEGE